MGFSNLFLYSSVLAAAPKPIWAIKKSLKCAKQKICTNKIPTNVQIVERSLSRHSDKSFTQTCSEIRIEKSNNNLLRIKNGAEKNILKLNLQHTQSFYFSESISLIFFGFHFSSIYCLGEKEAKKRHLKIQSHSQSHIQRGDNSDCA